MRLPAGDDARARWYTRRSQPREEITVPELVPIVADTLAAYYEGVRENIHELVAPLSTEQLWTRPYRQFE